MIWYRIPTRRGPAHGAVAGPGVSGARGAGRRTVARRSATAGARTASLTAEPYPVRMCRNITELRGLEPVATDEEMTAAARQYVRKVSGIAKLNDSNSDAFERAVAEVAHATGHLLAALPPRKQPPATMPPLRRPEVRARIAAREASRSAAGYATRRAVTLSDWSRGARHARQTSSSRAVATAMVESAAP